MDALPIQQSYRRVAEGVKATGPPPSGLLMGLPEHGARHYTALRYPYDTLADSWR